MRDLILLELGWATRSALVVLSAVAICAFIPGASLLTRNLVWRVCLVIVLCMPIAMFVTAKSGLTMRIRPSVARAFPSPLSSIETVPSSELHPDSVGHFDIWTRLGILVAAAGLVVAGVQIRMLSLSRVATVGEKRMAWQFLSILATGAQWMNPAIWLLAWNLRLSENELVQMGQSHPNRLEKGERKSVSSQFASMTAFCFIGLALASIGPTLAPSSGTFTKRLQDVAEAEPKPADPSDKDQFAVDSKPQILYIGDASSSGVSTWNMTGRRTPLDLHAKSSIGYGSSSVPGMRSIVVVFSISGIPGQRFEDSPFNLGVTAILGGQAGLQNQADIALQMPRDGYRLDLEAQSHLISILEGIYTGQTAFVVPARWKSADLELGMPTGEYRKVGEWIDGKGTFAVKLERKNQTDEVGEGGQAKRTTHVITFLHMALPKDDKVRFCRLMAYDVKGHYNPVFLPPPQPDLVHPERLNYVGIADIAPEDIHRINLEVRDYTWVKIKDVPLYPHE